MKNEINNYATSLLTVAQFAAKHSWPQGGLRHLLFSSPNGFEMAVRRVGRKVLIHETKFFEWIEQQNQQTAPNRSK